MPLLFTTTHGNPINDKTSSRDWAKWRQAACIAGAAEARRDRDKRFLLHRYRLRTSGITGHYRSSCRLVEWTVYRYCYL